MRAQNLAGSFWPSEQQRLLLRTIYAGGEARAEAWRTLRPQFDLDNVEPGTFPLLPLLHKTLDELGVDDPDVPRLAGIRRRAWYLNHLQLAWLTATLRALERAGADPLAIGGWDLALHYHRDLGLRVVDELDILVRPNDGARAADALVAAGFQGQLEARAGSRTFVDPDGRRCVVHQRFAAEFSVPERGVEPDGLWEHAVEVVHGETSLRAPGATDELLRVCVAGARTTSIPSVLWVADAMAVSTADGARVDWGRLVEQTERLRATLRVRDALLYLGRELDAPAPEDVLAELRSIPTAPRERLAHRLAGRRGGLVGPTPRSATRFLQVTTDRGPSAALGTLPRFLQDELGLARRRDVPLAVLRLLGSRIAERARAQPAARPPRVGSVRNDSASSCGS